MLNAAAVQDDHDGGKNLHDEFRQSVQREDVVHHAQDDDNDRTE